MKMSEIQKRAVEHARRHRTVTFGAGEPFTLATRDALLRRGLIYHAYTVGDYWAGGPVSVYKLVESLAPAESESATVENDDD